MSAILQKLDRGCQGALREYCNPLIYRRISIDRTLGISPLTAFQKFVTRLRARNAIDFFRQRPEVIKDRRESILQDSFVIL